MKFIGCQTSQNRRRQERRARVGARRAARRRRPAHAPARPDAELVAAAALGDVDQVPLIVEKRRQWPVAYYSDDGSPFPCVGIKGAPMILAVRVEDIVPGTHGQLTFGWRIA